MRLYMGIVAELSFNGEGKDMNDWADMTAAKLRAQHQEKMLQDAKFVEQQRIKKARGAPLWTEVRNSVKQNCDALNLNMKRNVLAFEVVPNTEISVRADVGGKHLWLKAEFDEAQGVLQWTCGDRGDKWELMVTDDGGVVFAWGMGIPSNP